MCVRFPRLRPGGTTVHSVLPAFFVCPFVYISFQFSVFLRSPHILATVQFRSVFQFIFLSGGLRDQWAAPVRVSAIIYDYFIESIYACRLCKTQRGTSLARVRANLSPTITFSDDTVGKHSRAFTTPRVVPFFVLNYLFHLLLPFKCSTPFPDNSPDTSAPCFFFAWTLVDSGACGTVSLHSSSFLSPTFGLLTYFKIPIREDIQPTLLYVLCSKCTYTSCTRLPCIPD